MTSLTESMSSNNVSPKFLNSLDASDLQSIEEAFYANTRRSKSQFVKRSDFGLLLSGVLSKGTIGDYHHLFDMVDISREGLIDWDRFSNFLLLEYYEREDRIKMSQIPHWQDIKKLTTPHKNSLCRILLRNGHLNRYCTVSKDGLVCIMNEEYEVKRTYQIHTNPEEIRSKDLWITDAAVMSNINKIAFTTTSRQILIYDMAATNDFVCQYKIVGMKNISLCMTYWSNKNDSNSALLAFGDTSGNVHAIFFKYAMSHLFEKPWKTEQSEEPCFTVNIESVMNGNFSSASCLQFKAHSSWVRQITFIPMLDCFLTCSTTSTDSIVLAFLGKSRTDVRKTEFKIQLGVNAFDYQESLNLIASAGINNHVCLWNPYVASKPVGVLRGHMQVIVAVNFMHAKSQLISFSKDKILRIWDINLQICVQRLSGIFPKGPDVNILLFYDQELCSLFASFNAQIQVLKTKREVKHRIISHDSQVTEAIYNEKYGHVISVDEASCITIWLLNTGQKVKHITDAHGDAEITTVCLDHSQTRILTAGTDGNIKIWDINGNCHHVLIVQDGNPCDISQILYLKRTILVFGWSKVVCCFPTTQLKSYYVYPTDWKGKQEHFDDILAADFVSPRMLVTASYDGDIVFWNTNTQNSIRKIANPRKPSKRNNQLSPLLPRLKSRMERKATKKSSLKASKSISSLKTSSHLSPIPTPRLSTPIPAPSRSTSTIPTCSSSPMPAPSCSSSPIPTPSRSNSTTPTSSSSANIEDSTSFVTVTAIKFMNQRNTNHPRCANLYSCHSDGHVRFWNSMMCEMLGEFTAFEQFGCLVSCVNSQNTILGVAGETGIFKLWNIESYLVGDEQQQLKDFIPRDQPLPEQQPLFLRSFDTHLDAVTCIKFVEKKNKLLIITASCDCSVALHTLDGLVGIFGQTEHWNINDLPKFNLSSWAQRSEDSLRVETLPVPEQEKIADDVTGDGDETGSPEVILKPKVVVDTDTTQPVQQDDVVMTDDNNWDNSVLRKAVSVINNKTMTGKIQLTTTNSLRSVNKRRNKFSYQCLETKQMDVVGVIQKPEFVLHPEKYFIDRDDDTDEEFTFLDELKVEDDLILKHDEKSIFPKYILDMDSKIRTANKIISNKAPKLSNASRSGICAATKPKLFMKKVHNHFSIDLSE